MTTAASAVVGRSRKSQGAATRSTAIVSAPTTPVSCVREPADSATGVREELLLIGKPPKRPAARFATPRPMSSRLGSTR
jgi:hypothetical protein